MKSSNLSLLLLSLIRLQNVFKIVISFVTYHLFVVHR